MYNDLKKWHKTLINFKKKIIRQFYNYNYNLSQRTWCNFNQIIKIKMNLNNFVVLMKKIWFFVYEIIDNKYKKLEELNCHYCLTI